MTFSQTVDEFYPAEIPEINPLLLETPATPAGMKAVRLLQINEAQEADFVAAKFKALRKNGIFIIHIFTYTTAFVFCF